MSNSTPKNRILPAKDASNFRSALKFYESKQYKKSLKTAEGVLKKHPNHGETLAVKGLSLYFMGKKEEGYQTIKKGLSNDLTSFVCWHILGIYYRQERNYEEAVKSYTKALHFDPQNQNVLRDLALLQMQCRQFDQLIVSRSKMLTDKPGYRQNWTALAVAQFLAKDYTAAENTLNSFEKLLTEPLPKSDVENSEVNLFKNIIIYQSGDVERALEHINSIADKILDDLSVSVYRAKYLLELGRKKEAEKEYRSLIRQNPDCVDYYQGLEKALCIDNDSLRLALFERMAAKYPKADAPRSIPLGFLTGDKFRQHATAYLEGHLKRGVPSLFVMVKPLYKDPLKRKIAEEVVLNFYNSLLEANDKDKQDDFSTYLWTLNFLAQHYSYLKQHELALEYIDKAVAHTPTLVELHMTRANVLKHCGDLVGASDSMEQARALDLQDRFINSKSAKYLLRIGKIDKAIEILSLFTKNDSNGKGVQDLHDMQAVWFLTEQAQSYAKLGDLGLALKRFHAVFKTYDEFNNDQYDFHFYCPRKGTIRAYLDMLKWADKLYGSSAYFLAAAGAINIYLNLADQKKREDEHQHSNGTVLDETERKKALKKAKKERVKELKEEEENASNKDDDVLGKKLLATDDPLAVAFDIWKPISDYPETSEIKYQAWLLGFEIYLRQQKYILAIQTLTKAKQVGCPEYLILEGAVRVKHLMAKDEKIPDTLRAVQLKILPTVAVKGNIVQDDLVQYTNEHVFVDNCAGSLLCWARAMRTLGYDSKTIDEKLAKIVDCSDVEIGNVLDALQFTNDKERLVTITRKKWPRATVFN